MIYLSYFTTTRNKLPYLKEVLTRLIANKQPDEEIIVVDAASTDGTIEYLTELHRQGKIDQFISEPDAGEAHGSNKAILMARGALIKVITDDDVFSMGDIATCKQYLLEHPEVDALGTNGLALNTARPDFVGTFVYDSEYQQHLRERIAFSFCGLGLMVRRSSLPILGLFDPNFLRVDGEYTLRITAGKAKIAWYTGYAWGRILNPRSNTRVFAQRIIPETIRLAAMYPGTNLAEEVSLKNRLHFLKTRLIKKTRKILGIYRPKDTSHNLDIPETFVRADQRLVEANSRDPGRFL